MQIFSLLEIIILFVATSPNVDMKYLLVDLEQEEKVDIERDDPKENSRGGMINSALKFIINANMGKVVQMNQINHLCLRIF